MLRRPLAVALALALGASLSGVACDAPPAPFDRARMLREIADEVIVPGYETVESDASLLTAAATSLCAAPSIAQLADAREAWRTLFLDWQRTGAYQLGPARDLNLGPEMAFWPTRPATIEANLAAPDVITAAWIDGLGAGGKGVYAIEYLLFALADDSAVDALSEARRCAYLVALAEHVERTSGAIVTAWRADGGDYGSTLATAGEPGNEVYGAQLAAVSALMTALVTQLESTKLAKIGRPLGTLDGLPQPGSVESQYAFVSVAAMEANLEGARRLWTGAPHGLDAYLRSSRPDLADTVLAQFEAARVALGTLPEPFQDYVVGTDHASGDVSYARLRDLERTLGTDVATALSVSVIAVVDGD